MLLKLIFKAGLPLASRRWHAVSPVMCEGMFVICLLIVFVGLIERVHHT